MILYRLISTRPNPKRQNKKTEAENEITATVNSPEGESTVAVKHHTAVSAGNVRTGKIVTGIFVGHNFFVYIIHRIQSNLITLV